jgi:hypothetical protein
MTSEEKNAMNLIYSIEFQINKAIYDNKPFEEFKQAYFDAQYNYVMIQHKLFSSHFEVAYTSEEAHIIVNNAWQILTKKMNEKKY